MKPDLASAAYIFALLFIFFGVLTLQLTVKMRFALRWLIWTSFFCLSLAVGLSFSSEAHLFPYGIFIVGVWSLLAGWMTTKLWWG